MASPPYEINKKRKSLKPQIELLIDEVTKTQQKIESLQSTLDNLQIRKLKFTFFIPFFICYFWFRLWCPKNMQTFIKHFTKKSKEQK